ncbi:MAG: prepilin-type N-terminal cleavage/methylation domain-containing protein [Candidatus Paceibacteria bacterium]|jgi:prepilin-type N-terminal cleavage/methylation domain-containing protein
MRNYFSPKKSGFTLIEIIVSLALFSVVVTIAVGALLILIASNRQLQDEQSVLSNLSFAVDSMTREIRTGANYFCAANNSSNAGLGGPNRSIFRETGNTNQLRLDEQVIGDCSLGNDSDLTYHGVAFDEGGDSVTVGATTRRIAFFHDRVEGKLYRRLSGEEPESIVSDGIFISDVDFYVTGSERTSSSDLQQPKMTIVIEAYNSESDAIADVSGDRAYLIQTTVTQRTLDI